MNTPFIGRLITVVIVLFFSNISIAQLVITQHPNAQALAQKLVGDGVTISNVSFSGNQLMAGFFNNLGGTNINIDSGIVLTSGRAKTDRFDPGMDGDGFTQAQGVTADNSWSLPGDADLAAAIGLPVSSLRDACVLEFDFVPLGDSIKFNYVFSSEEYTPAYVCSFNDAFAFFISGPGITGLKNIALVPGTNTPVSIFNVNNVPGGGCPNNTAYYRDNVTNTSFTHDGHTTVLTAEEAVQPCETYHLKLVISDVVDALFDSGVFLEAKSLSSNAIGMNNLTQTDPASGLSYLVEGCATGAFNISRPRRDPTPLVVNLSYGGTAINSVDVQALPTSVVIPANDSFVTVNVIPVIDGVPEGIEQLTIYALAGCAAGLPTDSTVIQIRDYDILSLTPDTAFICRNSSIQLVASAGYSIYQWNADPTLSSTSIRNPIATPVNSETTYICTAIEGTCNARDSVLLKWKEIDLLSQVNVNCANAATGVIEAEASPGWQSPEYSIDGVNWQATGSFSNVRVGNYYVRVRDGSCIDSIPVNIIQTFPDLLVDNITISAASCSGDPDGEINITASGGNATYTYSIDGTGFQSSNIFNVTAGNYTITVQDGNGCLATDNATIPLNNIVTVDAGPDTSICSGTSYLLPAISNGDAFQWAPATTLSNASILNPEAMPDIEIKYFITATKGICTQTDSVLVSIRPSPLANAGTDIAVCYGKVFELNGTGGASFEWSPGTHFISSTDIANPTVKAVENITYSLFVTNAAGCRSLTADEVNINVTPAFRIFAGNDTIAAMNQPLQLNASEIGNAGVTEYNWLPGTNLDNPSVADPVATLTQDTRYIVTGRTPEGCEAQDDVFIKVYQGPEIYVPKAFTPNNDGLNDILKAIPVGIREFRHFTIYNRWGNVIFSTKDPSRGWDGRMNGIEQQTNTFVWIAEAIDYMGNHITRKGVITLIK